MDFTALFILADAMLLLAIICITVMDIEVGFNYKILINIMLYYIYFNKCLN